MHLSAPRYISNMPHEIWLEIFEYFAPTPRQLPMPRDPQSPLVREGVAWTSPNPNTLYVLSQVCSLFNNLAMQVARRQLVVGPHYDIHFWVNALAKDGKGHLVKRIEVHNVHSGLLHGLMRFLPNATDMYLRHTNASITNNPLTTGTGVVQTNFQSLTDLTLSGLSAFATFQVLRNLSTVARALERLWLFHLMRGDANLSTAGGRYTLPHLEWLIVGAPGGRWQPGRADDAMRAILTAVPAMFDLPRIKRFDNLDVLGYQEPFFSRFGQQLEVIAITSEDLDLDTNADFPAHCPNLKTVVIVLIHRHLRMAMLQLPASVERIVIRIPEFLPWQAEEHGVALLRQALCNIAHRRPPALDTVAISGITPWGRSSGWLCRSTARLLHQGVRVLT
ncbi:hypothetical protein DFP72DRAFT_913110 [Ephemerocybe angulata]|uniref:F-box domain-containing protein n=1 Tax=Ephemerocybe angulata TaxID=980116 RepID=A0A8H6HNU1_9AGAR|nr:hypothetical protein DFP72DRAFT_913110 [Tulosesus angulatus]